MAQPSQPPSPRRLAAGRAALRKAQEADRRFRFAPPRRAALDTPRQKRKFVMTPGRRAALAKARQASLRNYRLTPARRAALAKAREANRRNFRLTPARRRASRATIRVALAAKRTPESYARSRFNHLKHGLYARRFHETMTRLGENRKEFEAFERLLGRAFLPQDKLEAKLLGRLSQAIWRRFRLFNARARLEQRSLRRCLALLPAAARRSLEETSLLAYGVFASFAEQGHLLRSEQTLSVEIERHLRALLRKRSGGADPQFRIFSPRNLREMKEEEEQEMMDQAIERLEDGDREAWEVLERLRPEWMRRKEEARRTGL